MKLTLIDNWRSAWKLASIRLAAVWAIMVGLLVANPILVVGLIGFLPDGWLRLIIALGVTLVVFIIPALARLLKKEPSDA